MKNSIIAKTLLNKIILVLLIFLFFQFGCDRDAAIKEQEKLFNWRFNEDINIIKKIILESSKDKIIIIQKHEMIIEFKACELIASYFINLIGSEEKSIRIEEKDLAAIFQYLNLYLTQSIFENGKIIENNYYKQFKNREIYLKLYSEYQIKIHKKPFLALKNENRYHYFLIMDKNDNVISTFNIKYFLVNYENSVINFFYYIQSISTTVLNTYDY